MMRSRDNQKSRVYAWEQAVLAAYGRDIYKPEFDTLDECEAFLAPIWRKERGRVGRAKIKAPELSRSLWGQRRATAGHNHVLKLPKWSRSRWVILHEAAHRLTPRDEAHGPRFVGVLIGLVCRWMDYDASLLMQLADEHGVKYHVRTIGVVPILGPAAHAERVIAQHGPMTAMDLACHLSLLDGIAVTERQVRGAALTLIRTGRARWLRNKLTLTPPAPTTPELKRKSMRRFDAVRALAQSRGIEIERLAGGGYNVWPPGWLCDTEADAHEGDHYAHTWGEVRERVTDYSQMIEPS